MSTDKNDFVYAAKAKTDILFEQPSDSNPYISKANFLHGYSVLELMQKKSFVEVLLLLFTGELPTPDKTKLLECLMIGLMNLGPRHPAVKSAMVAGVSKTNAEHLLPIGLSVLGGEKNGAKEVEQAIIFIQKNIKTPAKEVVNKLLFKNSCLHNKGEYHICPGFGNHYGGIDEFTVGLAQEIKSHNSTPSSYLFFEWANELNTHLSQHNMGWLKTGLAAAIFCELGIQARESVGLFQLICAPGIFAHGVEQTHNPITAIPMLSDEHHVYQPEK